MTQPPAGIPQTWTDSTGEGLRFRFAWEYRDSAGAVLGRVARFDDGEHKAVVPFFGRNGKAEGPPAPCSLFGLDTLKNPQAPVYLVEGEKAAAALHAMGLQAATSIGGAKAPNKTDWTPLQAFRTVYLLPDHDAPGEDYARAVAGILGNLSGVREVRVCRLPGLPDHGDVVDFLQSRLPQWSGFDPVPMEPGSDIVPELLEAIETCAVAAPAEWMTPAASAVEDWEAPVPLDAAVVPPWPADVFPPPVQAFVDALAASTETPVELSAMMVLPVLATAAQGKFRVRIKPDYFEPLCVWACCALPPGNRKTAVWQAAIAPLSEWERERRAEIEPERLRIQSERKTIEARIDALQKAAAKQKDPHDFDKLKVDIADLESDMPPVPVLPQLRADDITPENLATVMQDNRECMALLSDEGGMLDIIAGRYSNGVPNLDVYNQSHAGSAIRVNRGSRPPVFLEHPCLTVGICPQPDVVKAMQDKPGFKGRGFIGRFLYAMPTGNLGRRTNRAEPLPDNVRAAYHGVVTSVLNLPWNKDNAGRDCPHLLRLSPESYRIWHAFSCRNESSLAPGGTFAHATDWAGKLPGAVARIASVLHVARYAFDNPWEMPVGADDVAAAVRMADALRQHALIVFDCMGADAAMDDARTILEWIVREDLKFFTRRDCHKAHQHRFSRAPELDAPLEILTERGFIRRKGERVGVGRPSLKYEVNPLWDRNATK